MIVNLGSGKGYSVLDIINKSIEITKKTINYEFIERRVGDSSIVVAESKKAKMLMDWDTRWSDLDTIIKTTWNIYKAKYNA